MQGFNKVILAGNLTRDPELRYTQSGTAIAKFGLAVNRKWKDQSGNPQEEVTFVDVDAFGKSAEVIGNFLKKGRPVLIEGRLKLDQWEDKQTQQKRSRLGVVLESFTFLDSGSGESESAEDGANRGRERSDSRQQGRSPSAKPQGIRGMPPAEEMPPEEDDVPF